MLKMKGLTALTAHTLRPGGTYGDKGDIWGQGGIYGESEDFYPVCFIKYIGPIQIRRGAERGRSDHTHIGPGLSSLAHPEFGRSVNLISTRGTDYAYITTSGTPGF